MIYKSEIKNQKLSIYVMQILSVHIKGDLAQMVERVLSMHEAQGSIPWFSTFLFSDFMLFKSLYLLKILNKEYEYVKIAKIYKPFSLFA